MMRTASFLGLLVASAWRGADASCERARRAPTPLAVVLAAAPGEGAQAARSRGCRRAIRESGATPRLLERLGWTFVAQARSDEDPGCYELAEHAARACSRAGPATPARASCSVTPSRASTASAEAEALARELAAERGLPADHGLLGDALLSQGRLAEAAGAYQAMMDLRPDAHAYARAAELRWLTGDLAGAVQAMAVAARAVSPRGRDTSRGPGRSSRLYQLRAGAIAEAARSCGARPRGAAGLGESPGVVRGRILLAEDRPSRSRGGASPRGEREPAPGDALEPRRSARRRGARGGARSRSRQRLRRDRRGRRPARPRALPREPSTAISRARSGSLERELAARQDVFTLGPLGAGAQLAAGDAEGAGR